MAYNTETTFRNLQTDERFKKLERSLKLALLKQNNKNMHNSHMSPVPTWPSVSSINVDNLDSSYVTSSLQASRLGSDVLASSNNLRNIISKRKNHNINQAVMTTSSVKQYNVKQDNHIDRFIMPPPTVNKVYHAPKKTEGRVYVSSDCGKSVSTQLSSSIQSFAINNFPSQTSSCVSINTNSDKEYPYSFIVPMTTTNIPQKVDRVFSRWRVKLNEQHQLIIKGTLECGKLARSKPVIRRYTTTCIESINKHIYNLQGNIVDEKNELPDYIRGKFYNGFPDDWENVYQIWRTFVSQGYQVTFRWPTPITDSDDDLKSEITNFTCTYMTRSKANTLIKSKESMKSAEQFMKPENPSDKSLDKMEKYLNCTHNLQNHERSHSSVKSFISDTEKDILPVAQIKNINEEDKQNVKMNVNPLYIPKRTNKLKDFLQEDKLNIIINNLADKNCSSEYINKLMEMFDCLNYVISYRTETENNSDDKTISTSHDTSKSEAISIQKICFNEDNCTNNCTNKLESMTELKSHIQSSDLGYGSIKNESNLIHLSNAKNNIEPECNDQKAVESESEIYAGIPKISIERVLRAKESLGKMYKYKTRKKTTQSSVLKHSTNLQYNAKHELAAVPTTSTKKNLPLDESCASITEEEVEVSSTRKYHKAGHITQRPQDFTFCSHQELQRNNFDVYGRNTGHSPITHMQSEQPFITSEAQRVRSNVSIKEQKVSHGVQENVHSQFADVSYTSSSDVEKDTVITSTLKTNGTVGVVSHANLNREVMTINSENSNHISDKLHTLREFIEQPKSEILVKRAKPTIISSVPVNLNLKISNVDTRKCAQSHDFDVSIMENEKKQCVSIEPMQEAHKKKPESKISIPVKPAIVANDSHSKIPLGNKEDYAISNAAHNSAPSNKTESNNVNSIDSIKSTTNPTAELKNATLEKNNPKVLTAWIPKVVYNSKSKIELGLAFQGKLLNEAGHVVSRKFTTDIVLKRLSATLIETVNHEFYQLLGCLNDNKHVIPKELVKQCRNGCPAKIEQFCLTWKSLQQGEVEKIEVNKLHNASMDLLSVSVSSRGRRILPPLCYWTGERIILKDNTPVYSPGNLQESSLTSLGESLNKTLMTKESKKKEKQKIDSKNTSKKNSANKQKSLTETNEDSGIHTNQTSIGKDHSFNVSLGAKQQQNNVRKSDDLERKFRKAAINSKRKIAQQLKFSSTDSSDEEKRVFPRKHVCNSQLNTNVSSKYSMKLRKRQRTEMSSNRASREDASVPKRDADYCSPTKKSECKLMYAYYQKIPLPKDLLSEDQVSPI